MTLLFCFFFVVTVVGTDRVCDNGWIPYENHCYWCSPNPDNFHNAVVNCSGKGSILIEIKDAAEEKWVLLQSLIRNYTNLWIGLTDLVDEGQYVYSSSGLKPFYSNWEKSQPDGGVEDNEDCAALHTPQRKWHDYPCSDNHSYLRTSRKSKTKSPYVRLSVIGSFATACTTSNVVTTSEIGATIRGSEAVSVTCTMPTVTPVFLA
uniref:C-type lectin domain-containing protein n=1 Tax=Magallana gigas TaxID=29159 RepID=A0A8W8I828_MAGGI